MKVHPLDPATRDLGRVGSALFDAATEIRIAERAALGRIPWGFLNDRERKATLSDARRALEDAERVIRDTRRLIDLTEDNLCRP